jgi:protocatechuate 3,4-dioxygenase beta subunit
MIWASHRSFRAVRCTRPSVRRRARLRIESLESRDVPTIDGTAYLDLNLNGQQDPEDNGVAGITVTAIDDKGGTETTTTNSDGTYELQTDADNVRIEFSGFPQGTAPGRLGTVRFLNADSDRNAVDMPLASPMLVTTQFYYDRAIDGNNTDQPAVLAFPYGDPNPSPVTLANFSDVGSVWGVAYQPASDSIYVSSFVKRHAGLGPNADGSDTTTGGIYRIDRSTDPATVSMLIDLNASGSALATGADPHPNAAEFDNGDWYHDTATIPQVGKRGLGGMAMSPDGRTLYVMNLYTRELVEIPLLPDGTRDTSQSIRHTPVPLTNPASSGIANFRAGDLRPFSVTVNGNAVFIGETYTAETGGNQTAADLRAIVYAFDPTQGAFRTYNQTTKMFATSGAPTPVLMANLNYKRGLADDPDPTVTGDEVPADWQRWTPSFDTSLGADGFPVHPQPWLTSVVFDGDAMILGLRDRFGDQGGFQTGSSDTGDQDSSFSAIAVGDILRAAPNGVGGWQLESNGSVGGVKSGGAGDGQGPGGGEFYYGDTADPVPQEVVSGGLAQVPGFQTVAATGTDPVNTFSGGIYTFYNSNTAASGPSNAGTAASKVELYVSDTQDTFGSANGLGGLMAVAGSPDVQVGDRVFTDTNGNGIQDPGEDGIASVTLKLFQGSTQVATTTTGDDGSYSFGNLTPNTTYQIRVDTTQPSLATRSLAKANAGADRELDSNATLSGTTAIVDFTSGPAGSTDDSLDIGFSKKVSTEANILTLGNLVFKDLNNDGLFDGSDTGIPGVLVELLDGTGTPTGQTTTTNANGIYTFTNLADGTYEVRLAASNFNTGAVLAGYTSSTNSSADPNDNVNNDDNGITNGVLGSGGVVISGPIDLAAGTEPTNDGDSDPNTNLTLDFGMVPPAAPQTLSLGSTVFIDSNNNGLFDANESPIAGVNVDLVNSQGTVLQTHTTNALGDYTFTGLAPGEYKVRINQSNFTGSGLLVGFTSSTGTNGSATGPYEGPSTPDPNDDVNNDDNGQVVGTLGQPGGVIETGFVTLTAGGEPTNDGDTDPNTNLSVDLGVFRKFSIGNVVFNDLNNNGTQDAGDPGIANVSVRLLNPDANNALIATTTTNAQGQYLFTYLAPGNYVVELAATNFSSGGPLFGFQSSTGTNNAFEPAPGGNTDKQDHGTTSGTLGSGGVVRSGTITLGPNATAPTGENPNNDSDTPDNQSNLTVDFGLFQPVPATASVAGRVFLDFNNSGTFNGPDSGLQGVTLSLSGGNLAAPMTIQTDASGNFTFTNLAAGTYTLTETQPTTPANQTGKDTPGTANGTAGPANTIANIVLANAQAATGYLFAEVPIVSTGGSVFEDKNGNGKKDEGDPGIAGVTVTLTGTSAVTGAITPVTKTTGQDGSYKFDSLTPGTYTITETQPSTYLDGKEENGTPTATVTNDKFAGIDLTATAAASGGFDFGEVKTGSIAGIVFDDVDNNGTQAASGEAGIAGVSIRLTGTNDLSQSIDTTVQTGANGTYSFPGLRPGTYKLAEMPPAGYQDGKDTAGTSGGDAVTTNDQISNIALQSGATATGYLFAEHSIADIAISQSPTSKTVAPGGKVTITYTITNKGIGTASAVSALVNFGGLQFVSANSTDFNGTTKTWNIGALASGATKTITITFRVAQAGTFAPSVTATTTSPDLSAANNQAVSTVISQKAKPPVAIGWMWFLSSYWFGRR